MKLNDIIYDWVAMNFGQSEATDPSWDIEALADYISKSNIDPDELNAYTKMTCYDQLKEHFLEEDIEEVAKMRGYTLTKEEMSRVLHQYYKLDDETWEQIGIILDDIKREN